MKGGGKHNQALREFFLLYVSSSRPGSGWLRLSEPSRSPRRQAGGIGVRLLRSLHPGPAGSATVTPSRRDLGARTLGPRRCQERGAFPSRLDESEIHL